MKRKARVPGKPSFKPTRKDRSLVTEMASCGTPQEAIARAVGISHVTLRKHFRPELDVAADQANFRVAQFMFGTIIGTTVPGAAGH